MRAVVWLVEGTWEACVDAAAGLGVTEARLVHVLDEQTEAGWEGGPLGLMGRGRRSSATAAHPLDDAAAGLLAAAATRFGAAGGTHVEQVELRGRTETAVLDACTGADVLVCARDGIRTERGPHSLSKVTRYVVDHAPCAVLLVWPEEAPAGVDLPPAPDAGPTRRTGPGGR